ncbi:hypothetical protein Tco_0401140 [Tanacetum coccineum]
MSVTTTAASNRDTQWPVFKINKTTAPSNCTNFIDDSCLASALAGQTDMLIHLDLVMSQILSIDPLLTVNKAYYIVQQIEKQKQGTSHTIEPTTFFANLNNKGTNGYLDWYKGKKAKKLNKIAAHMNSGFDEYFSGDSPFDMSIENEIGLSQNGGLDQKLVVIVFKK